MPVTEMASTQHKVCDTTGPWANIVQQGISSCENLTLKSHQLILAGVAPFLLNMGWNCLGCLRYYEPMQ